MEKIDLLVSAACTCPPKTNNQKDPTVVQVEFTPAYLLGAWKEDPNCPRHGTGKTYSLDNQVS